MGRLGFPVNKTFRKKMQKNPTDHLFYRAGGNIIYPTDHLSYRPFILHIIYPTDHLFYGAGET